LLIFCRHTAPRRNAQHGSVTTPDSCW